jgi:chemosensory pili system protein ChpA (sensor histidine kinase/response regulator)
VLIVPSDLSSNSPGAPSALASAQEDLSALSWVAAELHKSLDAAHKALRRHLREATAIGASDVDAPDPAVLRTARVNLHQGVGALELVGQTGAAKVLRASEAAVQRFMAKPARLDAMAVEAIEAASFAVHDFLQRQLARRPLSPVALFPQYRAVQELAGGDRIHPADLWGQNWQWQELPPEPGVNARSADNAAREAMEALVLALMRRPDAAAMQRLSDFCAELAAGMKSRLACTVWGLAAAFFDAQGAGVLDSDVYAKRMASRLLAQLRANSRSDDDVSERLAIDLLFFCARARPAESGRAPRLAAVLQAWNLASGEQAGQATDYTQKRLGRFDPAMLAQSRKRVAAAKDAWQAVAGGELHRLPTLEEPMSLLGDTLARLLPAGDVMSRALQQAADRTVQSGEAPATGLAMEVATAMLWLDAALETAEFEAPGLAERVMRIAERVNVARDSGEMLPLEPWIEELYRRYSDQQTMGSVVQELRSTLSTVEKQVDAYFREPARRELLAEVPAQLASMRGVLSVLDLEQASAAVQHMKLAIDELAATEIDAERAAPGSPVAAGFERLADNLGALGFLIDMLAVQPALARSMFRFDAETGRLQAVAELSAPGGGLGAANTEPLTEVAQQLAQVAAEPLAVSDSELARQLEDLSQRALAADQTGLARVASQAKQALAQALTQADAGVGTAATQAVRADLAQVVQQLVPPAALLELPPPAPPRAELPPAPPGGTGLEEDAEMRGIFIDEAREVVAEAKLGCQRLADVPESLAELTLVRRAFHTLKGSARMVGLREFGEAAWACEQVYNDRLARDAHSDARLQAFTTQALDDLGGWVEAIASGTDSGLRSLPLAQRAAELRGVPLVDAPGAAAPLAATPPTAAPATTAVTDTLAALVPDLPSAADLDLGADWATPDFQLDLDPETATPAAPPPAIPVAQTQALDVLPELPLSELDLPELDLPLGEAVPARPQAADELPVLDFSLDLGSLDASLAPAATAPVLTPWPAPPRPPREAPAEPPVLADEWVLAPDLQLVPDSTAAPGLLPVPESVPEPLDEPLPELPEMVELLEPIELVADDEPLPVAVSTSVPVADAAPAEHLPEMGPVDGDFQAEPVQAVEAVEAEAATDLAIDEAAEASIELPATAPLLPALEETPPPSTATILPFPLPAEPVVPEEEQVKVIGDLRIGIALFNIFLNEADEQSRRLATGLAEWALEWAQRSLPEAAVPLAHSLAGNSATVGYGELSTLARALEHALQRAAGRASGRDGEAELFTDGAEEIRRLLHQFAAGFLKPAPPELLQRLADHERWSGPAPASNPRPLPPAAPELLQAVFATGIPPSFALLGSDDDIDAEDALDAELLPIFEEEAEELLPQLQSRLREWLMRPSERAHGEACMRTLHTFKGGARLAGAMRLGEVAHRMETAAEALLARDSFDEAELEPLVNRMDQLLQGFEALHQARAAQAGSQSGRMGLAGAGDAEHGDAKQRDADLSGLEPAPTLTPDAPVPQPQAFSAATSQHQPTGAEPEPEAAAMAATAPPSAPAIDWSELGRRAELAAQLQAGLDTAPAATAAGGAGASGLGLGVVRVKAALLDRLVNGAGEVAIARARIESDVSSLQGALGELTGSLERMRRELREIELQAESQISARIEAAKAESRAFDPLEMDRFTRLQELTRMMAESVNDVATLQRGLQRTLQSSEDQLAAQSRQTRELQEDLLRTRMAEFDHLAERLYRVVRQAAKDSGRQVRLDVQGGAIEVDRGVLERMVGPFEHVLRNAVVHGIEAPAERLAAGKDATGNLVVRVTQENNEVSVLLADDGAGLRLDRIRQRALERGLLAPEQAISDAELAQLIYLPGFSTATGVTELAGRGIGMDVVRAEVTAMGGRIETHNRPGQGLDLRIVLPLTTAVTQVVLLRAGRTSVAVPATLVELVRRVPTAEVQGAHAEGRLAGAGSGAGTEALPFHWLASLLQDDSAPPLVGRTQAVVVVRSAGERVALHVDEVLGNQEVVVKNLGPQLARLPGLSGVTLLPSGAVALIYNPVALVALYGPQAHAATQAALLRDVAARARGRAHEAGGALALPTAGAALGAAVGAAGGAAVGAAGGAAAGAMAPIPPLVLVVDDSLTVRRVTQRLLQREGYRVALAKDGMEALERLAEELPVVMLCDIEMPRMDGFELLRALKDAATPRRAQVPVVMITSRIAQKHRDLATELGAAHYLGKPYVDAELLALVRQYARQPVAAG